MAYNDSGELPVSQSTYSLGGYTFELKVQTVHEPGEEDVVSVFAICRSPDGTRETVPMDFPAGTTVESWTVEANETEATVYATVKTGGVPGVNKPLNSAVIYDGMPGAYGTTWFVRGGDGIAASDGNHYIVARSQPRSSYQYDFYEGRSYGGSFRTYFNMDTQYTYRGQTVYYHSIQASNFEKEVPGLEVSARFGNIAATAWALVYGAGFDEEQEHIIARFAIDIREADTEDWDEPGDDGPPGTTLYVTVTGATAGSCTGTPADNETVKGYGDGGDGGYGGGGGAGASTVIIYEFATSLADSVVQEAISRGPGTGGPGGKGGKGGDGCILIFY